MKRFFSRQNIALTALAVLFAGGLAVMFNSALVYLNETTDPPGYCRAQRRYISDEEFSQASLALLTWNTPRRKAYWDKNPELYAHYIRADERMERNRIRPGFVNVDRSDTHTIFRWLYGYQQIQVILNANSGDEFTRIYYDVCGKLIASQLSYSTEITTTNYRERLNEK